MQVVDGRKFSWKNGKGCTEASDLGWKDWPGSFYILSHRTGQQKLFLQGKADVTQDKDRELLSIDYFVPGGNVTVTIFND